MIYSALKKLPKESQPNLIEFIRLDTILNDSINVVKMDTIFMNSENSKTSEPHILKLKLADKLDLRLDRKVIALSNLSIYYTWNEEFT